MLEDILATMPKFSDLIFAGWTVPSRSLAGLEAIGRPRVTKQRLAASFFVGITLALALQSAKGMLTNLKRRCTMSPLLLMLLLSLVPFPVLAIAIVAERWMKAPTKSVS
jgi:hypothetical protein